MDWISAGILLTATTATLQTSDSKHAAGVLWTQVTTAPSLHQQPTVTLWFSLLSTFTLNVEGMTSSSLMQNYHDNKLKLQEQNA